MKSILIISLMTFNILGLTSLQTCKEDATVTEAQAQFDPRFESKYRQEESSLKLFAELGASDGYVRVAQKIINDEPLEQAELKALGDEIDHYYEKENGRRFESFTLLTFAVYKENLPAIRSLLEAGADVMAQNGRFAGVASNNIGNAFDGINAENLSFSIECVKLYLQYGGDPNRRSILTKEHVMSPYVQNNNIWAIRLLLDAGANPWLENKKGEPFLTTISETKTSMETLIYAAELGWFEKTNKENTDLLVETYSEYYHRKNPVVLRAYPEHDQDIVRFFEAILTYSDYEATPEMLAIINEGQS